MITMSGGDVFARDEGFPHNTTPMSEGFTYDNNVWR
jgi:hypothetical protein